MKMSVWGKIIGGTAGFALGGPLGAILGIAAGHGMDKANKLNQNHNKQNSRKFEKNKEYKEQIFATGVVVIAAKLSKADGKVTKNEIETFKNIFDFPKEDESAIADLFNAAKKDIEGYQVYASQLYEEFKSDKNILLEILNSLFAIAYSDKDFHINEEKMLRHISNIFKLNSQDYESIENIYKKTNNASEDKLIKYYKLLGVKETDSLDKIKQTYKKTVKDYHPDRLQGLGLPEEFVELANKKMAKINEAYNEIKKNKE